MTRIILANTGSDAIVSPSSCPSDESLQASARWAKRMLWLARSNDICITPTPVTTPFLDYFSYLTGERSIVVLSTSTTSTRRPAPLSKKDLQDSGCLTNSLPLLASGVQCLEPFVLDELSISVAQIVGDVPVASANRSVQASPEASRLLNNKVKFREFARNLGVPIANGSICINSRELAEGVCRALSVSDKAILKTAFGSGGEGNSIISRSASRGGSSHGAARSVCVANGDQNSVAAAVHDLGLLVTEDEPVIVEVYTENDSSIGVHFNIGPDKVEFVGIASILFDPAYIGAYWAKSLLDDLPNDVFSWCQKLSDYAQKVGHLGPLSVDIVRGKETGFFACEVNGRHGGFSTVRAVLNSVGLEADIKNGQRVVLSHDDISIDVPFSELVDRLEEQGLHYKAAERRGAIVITEGYEDKGPFDVVIVGVDLAETKMIERDIIKLTERTR
ncbi:peptide ligase PGM1-related protein [Mesorhizobium sp. M8A.F.Ca.ET.165.01.1.1]|uniref:preATP grasp domain-containing protein n=1 Tax=Mesorhizobium sp. M8A.F.Ca.ET.165.01.1.1 TaxID=2563960 RepID=UPI001093A65A|nr:peptide ligase PGM1-related protein [Mesorhizobium sp. M8A.F.Ca.ET.165.01.1.1]TGT35771.1 hypothetical protein EN808_31490 [Mesorhizobium sp. M8A.F.Ca.ET.165.01.1.1]